MHEDLLRWREEFPILDRKVYLINNSLGAMPRGVEENLQDYARIWSTRGVEAWEERWWEMPREVGDLLGGIIGAGPGEVSLHQNVTVAEWIVYSALEPAPQRNRVVYSSLNFPSVRYFYQAQAGIETVAIDSRDGITVPQEELLEAIDERTLLVPISHVIFKSSYIQDVEAIVRKARSVGAMVLLDVYQSVGTVPIDVCALGAHFVTGGSIKWLCGGPGVGFLWVEPGLADRLQPRLTGWMAHENPFAFEPEMRYTKGPYRYMNGTPHIPALYAARSGYQIICEVGVDRIRSRSLHLTQRILDLAAEFGFAVGTPRDARQRGGHVTVAVPEAERVSRELLRRDFSVDFRPGAGIRVAPHFYNTESEVDRLMKAMHEIVQAIAV